MNNLYFSIIIPVYNRPVEVAELLASLTKLNGNVDFEVVIVEDGSEDSSENIVSSYKEKLSIQYFFTENQGAGKSRNYGMQKAKGNYFIVLDSDCLVPEDYLLHVKQRLNENYTDAFGGPDAAHESFTNIQKAINYSMTSFLTTGGIRGKKKGMGKFQPRSFNFGISKKAFEITGGFNHYKIGEDIDLTFRLWNNNFDTQLIEDAFVYHKRRTSFIQFYKQTNSFGKARPYLNKRFPGTGKITYWFPSLFLLGFFCSFILSLFGESVFFAFYVIYFICLGIHSTILSKSVYVGVLTIFTTGIQFYGYGSGFLLSKLTLKPE
jgi:glycosyltransferase involved in cell wall biosynthesis